MVWGCVLCLDSWHYGGMHANVMCTVSAPWAHTCTLPFTAGAMVLRVRAPTSNRVLNGGPKCVPPHGSWGRISLWVPIRGPQMGTPFEALRGLGSRAVTPGAPSRTVCVGRGLVAP